MIFRGVDIFYQIAGTRKEDLSIIGMEVGTEVEVGGMWASLC